MSEIIEEIFLKQHLLQDALFPDHPIDQLDDIEREQFTKEYVLAIQAELIEVLDEINWKIWKRTRVTYDDKRIERIQFELIDILHFYVNLCLIWGITPKKLQELYDKKNAINHERQKDGY